MIVWYGRRPGSTAPDDGEAGAAVLEDDAGAAARRSPSRSRSKRLWMNETAIRSPSTAHR